MAGVSQSVVDPGMAVENRTQNDGNGETKKPGLTGQEVRQKLNELINEDDFRDEIIKIFRPILIEVKNIDDRLKVNYHVVFFNKEIKQRFTIVESNPVADSDQMSEENEDHKDYKELTMGVVGILIKKMKIDNFLMVQFSRTDDIVPIVYYDEANEAYKVKPMDEMQTRRLLQKDKKMIPDVVFSREKNRKFAIASIKLSDEKKHMIGAVTIDFSVDEYPNFAFRDDEINIIYNSLHAMKNIIEFMLWRSSMCKTISEAYSLASGKNKSNRGRNLTK